MSLINSMQLFNILHTEDSSVDVGLNWIDVDQCHIAYRFNEDDQEDIEFHMMMSREQLEDMLAFLTDKLRSS